MAAFSDLIHSLGTLLGGRSVGKALLALGLAVCVYQVCRRWYVRRLVARKFRGKVVLITGASSGLGEGDSVVVDVFCTVQILFLQL